MANFYQLSPHYRLSSKKDKAITLYHILDEETFLINAVIHSFLSFFAKKPIRFDKAVQLFAKKYDSTPEEVIHQVNQFFGEMFYKSILIHVEHYTHLLSFSIQKDLQEEELLTAFDLIKTLAKEYFLSIFLVQNKETGVQSVLKILHLNAFFRPEEREQYYKAFLQETNIYKEIKGHPSIIELLRYEETKDVLMLELAYSSGIGLHKFIASNKKLTFSEKKLIYTNILEAYAYLHSTNILHGDIHAGNILVKEDFSVKIIDFDMAYHNTRRRGETISQGGVQNYIAPEKITKNAFKFANKRADFRSEVYQLGIIGYAIFIESLPFEAESWKSLATKIKNEPPLFTSDKVAILPNYSIDFLQKSLDKNPQNRFVSAIEMYKQFLLLGV
jgi:eukaryotic-like serine/threonine-protein kinase